MKSMMEITRDMTTVDDNAAASTLEHVHSDSDSISIFSAMIGVIGADS